VTLHAGQSTTSQAGSELGGNGATANGGAANGLTNAGGGPSGAPTGGLNGGGTGTAATGSVASSSGSVSAGSTQVSVRGINSSAVTVGAVYFNTDNVNNLNPAAPQQAGSGQIEQRAVAAYINSHGGIAGGRKIQLVEHEINVQDEPATQAQSACADFTQDHHVYAVVGQSASAFVSCLAPQHVLTIAASVDAGTQTDFAKSNNTYWAPTSMETVAAGAAEIEEMRLSITSNTTRHLSRV
jgi:hypothetical protein